MVGGIWWIMGKIDLYTVSHGLGELRTRRYTRGLARLLYMASKGNESLDIVVGNTGLLRARS